MDRVHLISEGYLAGRSSVLQALVFAPDADWRRTAESHRLSVRRARHNQRSIVVAGQQEDRVREQYGNQVIASAEWRWRVVLMAPTPFCRSDTVYQICFLTDYREGKSQAPKRSGFYGIYLN